MIDETEYRLRRDIFLQKLPQNSITLLLSAQAKVRSNDTEYPYRQESNFYYLSGFREENAALLFVKTPKMQKQFLFVEAKNPQKELWNGKRCGVKKAKKIYRFDSVFEITKLSEKLQKYSGESECFAYLFKHEDEEIRKYKKLLANISTCKDAGGIVEQMRLLKSPAEIALIQKALSITQEAHHRAMQRVKRSTWEYELQAEIEYVFRKNGAYSDAYTSIVAAGNNANTLHYITNSAPIQSNDLILIDAGCEYEYYASDITRTIPASGKFTKEQLELYTLVLEVEKKIISMVKEGVLRSKLQKKAQKMLTEGMIQLGILRGSFKKLYKKEKFKKYYPHGIGHYMGLDVHDQNPYKDKHGKEIALRAGMVLTIEPGIYLPKDDTEIPKKYRGIGIRIEDDILVTKKGAINLSEGIAKEPQEIESLCSGE